MGIWGSIKKGIGKVGDVAKYALPVASFIPGVNLGVGALAGLGALAGAAGTLNDKGGTSVGKALLGGAKYGALGYGAGKLEGAIKGAGGLGALLRGGGGAANAAGTVANTAGGGGGGGRFGGLGGLVGGAWDLVKRNPELALGALGAWQGGRAQGRANDLQNEALGIARADYDSRAPLREMALGALQRPRPGAPDFSAQFADPGNAYNRIAPGRDLTQMGGNATIAPAAPVGGAPTPEAVLGAIRGAKRGMRALPPGTRRSL